MNVFFKCFFYDWQRKKEVYSCSAENHEFSVNFVLSSLIIYPLWVTCIKAVLWNLFLKMSKHEELRHTLLNKCSHRKLKFSNPYIIASWWYKPLIFQTQTIIWFTRIYSLKYQRSKTWSCKDKGFKNQSFRKELISFIIFVFAAQNPIENPTIHSSMLSPLSNQGSVMCLLSILNQ